MISRGWEGEQYLLGASCKSRMADYSDADRQQVKLSNCLEHTSQTQ